MLQLRRANIVGEAAKRSHPASRASGKKSIGVARCRSQEAESSHLVAESLDISLGKLLAGHQALNPPVERGNRGGLVLNRRDVGRRPSDVLHIGIHGECRVGSGGLAALGRGARAWDAVFEG